MSFISSGGVSKWSQIPIDADKDMGAFGLSNLKQVAAAMVTGDIIAKGPGGILVRIPASVANMVLTSNGALALPSWQPGGLYLNRYIPAAIKSSNVVVAIAPDQTLTKNIPIISPYVAVYLDTPASNVKRLTPAIASSNALVAGSPDKTVTQSMSSKLSRRIDWGLSVVAALSYLATVYTNETTQAQNSTVNDMHLMNSPTPQVNDAYYFACNTVFDYLYLVLGTQGVGNWGIVWEYWNGAWVSLAGVTDGTNNFMNAAGAYNITFTQPGDWATTSVNGVGPYYYIRARVGAYTSNTTIPLGTLAVCMILNRV